MDTRSVLPRPAWNWLLLFCLLVGGLWTVCTKVQKIWCS